MTDDEAAETSPQQSAVDLPSPNLPAARPRPSPLESKLPKKRGREGSTEPGSIPNSSASSMHRLATKKNRIEPRVPSPPTDDNHIDANPEEPNAREAGNVGEVRKKVEKMTWSEGGDVPAAPVSATPSDMDMAETASMRSTDTKQTHGMNVDEREDKEKQKGEDVEEELSDEEGEKRQDGGRDEEMEDNSQAVVKAVEVDLPVKDQDARMASEEPQTPLSAVDKLESEDRESGAPAKDEALGEDKQSMAIEPDVISEPTSPDLQSGSISSADNGKKRKFLMRNASSTAPLNEGGEEAEKAKRVKEDDSTKSPSSAASPVPRALTPPLKDQAEHPASSAETTPVPAKKPQTTFASFSTKQSPFVPSTSSTGFLSSTSSSSAAPAIKKVQSTFSAFSSSPSAFAGASKSTSASGSGLATSVFSSTPTKSSNPFGGYAFGESPFASRSGKKPAGSLTGAGDGEEENDSQNVTDDKAKDTFGDILAENTDKIEKEPSKKLDISEKDHVTGEEDEIIEHQCRAKLYYMESNGGWKERGTGSLHLNIGKTSPSARLVMRAEGVFRLILNVPLFAGMSCEPQDKYVKTTVMENGKLVSLLIRTASSKAAEDLHMKIQKHIPFEVGKSARESLSPGEVDEPLQTW